MSIPLICNCLGIINEVKNFFRSCAQRQGYLSNAVIIKLKLRKNRLQTYCETRWLERLDSIITLKKFFLHIINSLEEYSSTKPLSCLQILKFGNFIIAMLVMHGIFSITYPFSISLQATDADLASTIQMSFSRKLLLKCIVNPNKTEINYIVAVVLKQWPNITQVCDSIVNKEALLWQQINVYHIRHILSCVLLMLFSIFSKFALLSQ